MLFDVRFFESLLRVMRMDLAWLVQITNSGTCTPSMMSSFKLIKLAKD